VIFNKDGNTVVIFKNDGNPDIYSEESRYEIRSFPGNHTMGQFSIPTRGWEFSEYDFNDPEEETEFEALAFSADWHFLAAPGPGDTVTLWDLRTGRQPLSLSGHTESTIQAEFTKDNCRLVTASTDGTVRVWARHCR
jgi:WD40 repeat protein